MLAVSRAFGDWEFKGEGLAQLMVEGVERGYWDDKTARSARFTSDPVIPTPDVTEIAIKEGEDEFLLVRARQGPCLHWPGLAWPGLGSLPGRAPVAAAPARRRACSGLSCLEEARRLGADCPAAGRRAAQVGTDGLWDYMPFGEAVRFARKQFQQGMTAQQVGLPSPRMPSARPPALAARRPGPLPGPAARACACAGAGLPDPPRRLPFGPQVAQSLTEVAEKRYTQDNVAVAVVDLKGAQGWSSEAAKPKGGLLAGLFGKR